MSTFPSSYGSVRMDRIRSSNSAPNCGRHMDHHPFLYGKTRHSLPLVSRICEPKSYQDVTAFVKYVTPFVRYATPFVKNLPHLSFFQMSWASTCEYRMCQQAAVDVKLSEWSHCFICVKIRVVQAEKVELFTIINLAPAHRQCVN